MLYKPFISLLAVLIVLTLASCHPLFCVWNMGYKEVSKADVLHVGGVYKLTDYSKKMMLNEGHYTNIPDSRLKLFPDGNWKLSKAPDWLIDDFGNSHHQYIAKQGKWSLMFIKGKCMLSLKGFQEGILLYKKTNEPAILLTVGDPDGCQGMVYEKQ